MVNVLGPMKHVWKASTGPVSTGVDWCTSPALQGIPPYAITQSRIVLPYMQSFAAALSSPTISLCWTSTHLALRNRCWQRSLHWRTGRATVTSGDCSGQQIITTHVRGADSTAAELTVQHYQRAPCRGGPPCAASPHQQHKLL